MKEIVMLSGKGGTGKTSITAAFASLAKNIVLVDCDVDAADLHLVFSPEIKETHDFSGAKLHIWITRFAISAAFAKLYADLMLFIICQTGAAIILTNHPAKDAQYAPSFARKRQFQ